MIQFNKMSPHALLEIYFVELSSQMQQLTELFRKPEFIFDSEGQSEIQDWYEDLIQQNCEKILFLIEKLIGQGENFLAINPQLIANILRGILVLHRESYSVLLEALTRMAGNQLKHFM